jgi:hypothetical protein
MAAAKDPPPKREKIPFVEDTILRETVKKETFYARPFTEFRPSLASLSASTHDKPLVDTYASRLYARQDREDEVETQLRNSLGVTTRDLPLHQRYNGPVTTSMDYGWYQHEVPGFKSMFDHRRMKTEITMLPSRWDPNANVMTVKEKPPK